MAQQTVTTATDILREDYGPGLWQQFKDATPALNMMKKVQKDMVGGKYFVQHLHSARNEAIAGRAEEAVLPVPGYQGYDRAVYYPASVYGHFQLTGNSIDACGSDVSAIADMVDAEVSGLMKQVPLEFNRMLYGNGSGILAKVLSVSTTTVTLDTAYTWCPSTRWIREGMTVAFHAADATGSSAVEGVVSSITSDSVFTTTTDLSGSISVGDVISRAGLSGTTSLSLNNEPYGFFAAFSTKDPSIDVDDPYTAGSVKAGNDPNGYYGGITRDSGNAFWAGNIKHNSGTNRAITVDLFMEGLQACRDRGSASLSDLVAFAHFSQWRKLGVQVSADRRWTNNIDRFDLGWRYIDVAGVPVIEDSDCPKNAIVIMDKTSMELLYNKELGWMDKDGSILSRVGSGTGAVDAYAAALYMRCQVGCKRPSANCLILDLSE